jgi:hypothetical protein
LLAVERLAVDFLAGALLAVERLAVDFLAGASLAVSTARSSRADGGVYFSW